MCKQEKNHEYLRQEDISRRRRRFSFKKTRFLYITAHIPHNRKLHEHGFMLTLTFNKTTLARLKVKAIFTKRVASSVKCTIESRLVVVGYQS